MNLKRSIKIVTEKRKYKGKEIISNVPIRIRITYAGNRVDLYSGFRIDLKDWDKETSSVLNQRTNSEGQSSDEINIAITNYKNELQRFFLEYSAQSKIPTNDEIKNKFLDIKTKYNPEKYEHKKKVEKTELNLFEVFDLFTSHVGRINNWTEDTYSKYNSLKNHLLNYNENLKLEDLTDIGLSNLVSYFSKELKIRNSTIRKHFVLLANFLRYAYEKEHTSNDSFSTYKPKLKKTEKKVIFLTEDEINQIRKLKIPETKQYLERIRDVLIFLCYSGLRHSDIYNLKKNHIKDGKFEVTTQKTSDNLIIELNTTTKSIIDKYKHIPFKQNKALPVISNQKMNDYLKELGELAGINEPVNETYFIGNKRHDQTKPKYEYMTTHIGRRSFICLCIAKGIPVQVIMKWTGHTDYKSMKPYIDISGKTKEIEMDKLNF